MHLESIFFSIKRDFYQVRQMMRCKDLRSHSKPFTLKQGKLFLLTPFLNWYNKEVEVGGGENWPICPKRCRSVARQILMHGCEPHNFRLRIIRDSSGNARDAFLFQQAQLCHFIISKKGLTISPLFLKHGIIKATAELSAGIDCRGLSQLLTRSTKAHVFLGLQGMEA